MTNQEYIDSYLKSVNRNIELYYKHYGFRRDKDVYKAVHSIFYRIYRGQKAHTIDNYNKRVCQTYAESDYWYKDEAIAILTKMVEEEKARKIAYAEKRATKTKLYSISMSEAEYKKVLAFLKEERSKK